MNKSTPWALGLLVAVVFCSNYFLMFGFRKIWQSHYPELAARWANNGSFAVIGYYGTELTSEELSYGARVKEASERFWAYDPYIRENKSFRLFALEPVTYLLLGRIQNLTGDITWTWVVTRFLCCLFWGVLLYALALRATGSAGLAAFCAVFLPGFSYLLTGLALEHLTWRGGPIEMLAKNAWTLLSYGRTESILRLPRPGFIWAVLMLGAYFNIRAAESPGAKWALISGLFGGLMAYVRLDIWSTYMVTTYVFAAVMWAGRGPWKPLLGSAVLATILSLPFLYFNYPPDRDLMIRCGIKFQRHMDWPSLWYLGAFLAAWRWKRSPAGLYLGSLMAGVFVMVNIELVTGYNMWSDHWKFLGNVYAFLLAASFLPESLKRQERLWLGASTAALVVILLQSIVYAGVHYPFQGLPRDYDDAFSWLRKNSPRDSVVLTFNPEVNLLLAVRTDNKVLLSNVIPTVSDIPLSQNAERLLSALDSVGAERGKFFKEILFQQGHNDRRGVVAEGLKRGEIEKKDVYSMLFYLTPRDHTRRLIEEAASRKTRHRPDYLWFGHLEKETASPSFPKGKMAASWREVYRNPAVTLYRNELP